MDVRVSVWEVPGGTIVEYPLLHRKCIRVSPEVAVVIESIEESPVYNDILAIHLFVQMDLVHVDLELDQLLEVLGREADLHDSLLHHGAVIEVDGVLLNILSLLINNIWIKLPEIIFVRIPVLLNFRHE